MLTKSVPIPRSVKAVQIEKEWPKEWQIVRANVGNVKRWRVQDKVNQEESEKDEVGGMKKEVDFIQNGADSTS